MLLLKMCGSIQSYLIKIANHYTTSCVQGKCMYDLEAQIDKESHNNTINIKDSSNYLHPQAERGVDECRNKNEPERCAEVMKLIVVVIPIGQIAVETHVHNVTDYGYHEPQDIQVRDSVFGRKPVDFVEAVLLLIFTHLRAIAQHNTTGIPAWPFP